MLKSMCCYIGFDPRESDAFAVARTSMRRNSTIGLKTSALVLDQLRKDGLYNRPTDIKETNGRKQLWDVISQAPCATEFSLSRFLVPHLAKEGYALFVDCDVLVRGNMMRLFQSVAAGQFGSGNAIWCVKHDHQPNMTVKMDGQAQTAYPRKNWSSVMLFDCDHPSNRKLTVEMVNSLPGRDLHRFCWLEDDEIGELSAEWNYLVGHTKGVDDPKIVHFTDGVPTMPGYEHCEYADDWRAELYRWAA